MKYSVLGIKSTLIVSVVAVVVLPVLLVFNSCSSSFSNRLVEQMGNASNNPPGGGDGPGPGPGTPGEGIAANYPLDGGIESDPMVIFAEDFESGDLDSLLDRWSDTKNEGGMSLASDSPVASQGSRALQMTRLGGNDTGGHVRKRLEQINAASNDKLHLRYYIKLDDYVLGQKSDGRGGFYTSYLQGSHHHTGGGLSGVNHNCNWGMGRAGIRPTGGSYTPSCPGDSNHPIYDNRFSARLEMRTEDNMDDHAFRNDRMDFYNYWMGMHHNASSPQYYGNSFVGDYGLQYNRQEWVCVEYMVKLNNPVSAKNGEIKLWINGRLVTHLYEGNPQGKWLHSAFLPLNGSAYIWNQENWTYSMNQVSVTPFEGFQWRDNEVLKLNIVSLAYYVTKDTQGNGRVWYDNVVVAKDYIGPISQ